MRTSPQTFPGADPRLETLDYVVAAFVRRGWIVAARAAYSVTVEKKPGLLESVRATASWLMFRAVRPPKTARIDLREDGMVFVDSSIAQIKNSYPPRFRGDVRA